MRRLTPGNFALARHCAFAWSDLAPPHPAIKPGDPARFGTAISQAVACATAFGAAPIDEIVAAAELPPSEAQRLRDVAHIVVERIAGYPAVQFRAAELCIAVDLETGEARELPQAFHRDYSAARESEVVGTLDLVEVDEDGLLIVSDYKTGRDQAQTLVAATDPQLRTYAWLAAKLFGFDHVYAEFRHASVDGIRAESHDIAKFDAFELDLIEQEVREDIARPRVALAPQPGAHCAADGYCPIRGTCPATAKAVAVVLEEAAAARVELDKAIKSEAHAALLFEQLATVEEAITVLKAVLQQYTTTRAIELSTGKWWGPVDRAGDDELTVDAQALFILRKHLGDLTDETLDISTSKAAIERAVKKLLTRENDTKRGAIKSRRDPIFEELRAAKRLNKGAPYKVWTTFSKKEQAA